MTEQTQLILGMFVPIYAIGGWALKILWDMNTRLGDIKADVNNKFGDIKTELADIKAEIRSIHKRLDSLETGVVTRGHP
ncbi:MAG: hypothetical protein ACXVB2_12510 [Isosphaeraceae bacterium]